MVWIPHFAHYGRFPGMVFCKSGNRILAVSYWVACGSGSDCSRLAEVEYFANRHYQWSDLHRWACDHDYSELAVSETTLEGLDAFWDIYVSYFESPALR